MFSDFVLRYGLQIFSWVIFALAVFFYTIQYNVVGRRYIGSEKKERFFAVLIIAGIMGRLIDAAIKTAAQYYLWSGDALTRPFLNSGLNPETPGFFSKLVIFQGSGGYFLFYSLTRFWFSVLASILIAFIFSAFLKVLRRGKERFFEAGEVKLGVLTALLVGWPNFMIFLPLVFGSILLISAIRAVFFKIKYTTLGFPFVVACGATLILGGVIGPLINLNVLRI